MRIIHTSDWHLGRSLHGEDLSAAQKLFFDFLVQQVQDHRVDLVLISGDFFDRGIASLEALNLASKVLDRLLEHCQVVITPGNHDSATRLGFLSPHLNQKLHIVSDLNGLDQPLVFQDPKPEPGTTTDTPGDLVQVWAIPYLHPDLFRQRLWDGYDPYQKAGAQAESHSLARSHQSVLGAALRRIGRSIQQLSSPLPAAATPISDPADTPLPTPSLPASNPADTPSPTPSLPASNPADTPSPTPSLPASDPATRHLPAGYSPKQASAPSLPFPAAHFATPSSSVYTRSSHLADTTLDSSSDPRPETKPGPQAAKPGRLSGSKLSAFEKPDPPRVFRIIMAHAFVLGGSESDSERDISVGTVPSVQAETFSTYGRLSQTTADPSLPLPPPDYIALGHLHRPQKVTSPHPEMQLRYSGSPLAFSFSEARVPKSIVLLDTEAENLGIRTIPCPIWRPLARISGPLEELLSDKYQDYRNHFLEITVTDPQRHPQLIAKLKTVFPFALAIYHQPQKTNSPALTFQISKTKQNPLHLSEEFFTQNEQPLTKQESALIRQIYERARQEIQEGA